MMRLVTLTVAALVMTAGQVKAAGLLDCNAEQTLISSSRATIQSVNFPKDYLNLERCPWVINCTPKNGTYLKFKCPRFELDSSSGCKDYLRVESTGQTKVYCGTDSPNGLATADGWASIFFSTDGADTANGFRCFVWCHPK